MLVQERGGPQLTKDGMDAFVGVSVGSTGMRRIALDATLEHGGRDLILQIGFARSFRPEKRFGNEGNALLGALTWIVCGMGMWVAVIYGTLMLLK